MLVRITRQPAAASVDGFALCRFRTGSCYSLPTSLATLMIVEGWAEPVIDSADCTLPEITFEVLPRPERRRRMMSDDRLASELGIAADRRRRR